MGGLQGPNIALGMLSGFSVVYVSEVVISKDQVGDSINTLWNKNLYFMAPVTVHCVSDLYINQTLPSTEIPAQP